MPRLGGLLGPLAKEAPPADVDRSPVELPAPAAAGNGAALPASTDLCEWQAPCRAAWKRGLFKPRVRSTLDDVLAGACRRQTGRRVAEEEWEAKQGF
jgi:hypothetical protein